MGIIARIVGWAWRRWADYQSVIAIFDLFDIKTAIVGGVSFVVTLFLAATNFDWSWQAVGLAALAATALICVILVAARALFRGAVAAKPQETAGSTSSTLSDLQQGKWEIAYPPPKSILVPNWRLHELFLHIDPEVFSSDKKFRISEDLKDKFSTMQLASWGRKIVGSKRLALAPIPSSFWADATFTYEIPEAGNPSVWDARSGDGIDYADVQVNKAQAVGIWPSAKNLPEELKMDITNAARRAYSDTQDSTFAKISESRLAGTDHKAATPDEILLWYAETLARHSTVWGCRAPSDTTKPQDLRDYILVMRDQGIIARQSIGENIITNLMVSKADLDAFVEKVKTFPRTPL